MVRLLIICLLACGALAQAQDEPLLPQSDGYLVESGPDNLTIRYFDSNLAEYPIGECEAEEGKVSRVKETSLEVMADLPQGGKGEYMMITLKEGKILSGNDEVSLQEAKDRIIRYSQALRLSRSRGLVVFEVEKGSAMLPLLELLLTTSRTERLAIRLGDDPTKFAELSGPGT